MNEMVQQALNKLFDELVPFEGKAENRAGEMVRAVNRIIHRFYNDGDQIGMEYGKETCNAPARFLAQYGSDDVLSEIEDELWGGYTESHYERHLEKLATAVIIQITAQPELRNQLTEDMWDFFNKDEDRYEEYAEEEENEFVEEEVW